METATAKRKLKTVTSIQGATWKVPPKIRLPFNMLLTSTDALNVNSKLIDTSGVYSTQQVVLAKGPLVSEEVQIGDVICINVDMFPRTKKPGPNDVGEKVLVHAPIETIDGKNYFLISERHIKYFIDK